ncbi:MAG: DsrE family protein [Pseudomonadales bacterium]|nr:DsrE family protein [Pseudomonadales bacterium]
MTHSSAQKYLINCQEGSNNIERATISFILAVTSSKSNETAVFMTSDASMLCVKGQTDGMVAEGYEPLKDLIATFIDNGGKIWLCPACVKAKGITEGDLLSGVEIAGAPKTMAFLANGAQLLA